MRGANSPRSHSGLRGTASAVGTLIPGLFERLGLAEPFARWRAVAEWKAIVGESLALRAEAVRVQGQTLIVETDDPFGLSHYKHDLLKLVQEHIGSDQIREIRLEHRRHQEARP